MSDATASACNINVGAHQNLLPLEALPINVSILTIMMSLAH